jgi:hypothetical protein
VELEDFRLALAKANNPKIQIHFQSLKNALKVISQNAKLPVFMYNAQGQERYMWDHSKT